MTATKLNETMWVGDWQDAHRFKLAKPDGRVITVAHDSPLIGHHMYPIRDGPFQENDKLFWEAIDKVVSYKGTGIPIIVQCTAGISRSSAVVIGAAMRTRGISADSALEQLRKLRPQANPNPYFMALLHWSERRLITPPSVTHAYDRILREVPGQA